MPHDEKDLTLGERLVGIGFNPSNNSQVDRIKEVSAELIDIIDANYNVKTDGGQAMASWELNVLRTAAINAIITAQMAAVKFITWKQ